LISTSCFGTDGPSSSNLAGLEASSKSELLSERQVCRRILDAMGGLGKPPNTIKRCKVDGLGGLAGDDRRRLDSFLDQLARTGIFLVPVGELERWLPQFRLTNKPTHPVAPDVVAL
jgi:hypothetical protein